MPGRVTRLAAPVEPALPLLSSSTLRLRFPLGPPGNGESAPLGRQCARGRHAATAAQGARRVRSFLEQTNRCSLPVLPCNEFNVSPGPAVAPAVVAVAVSDGARPSNPRAASRSLTSRRAAFRLPFGRGSTAFCFPTSRRPAGKKLMRLCLCHPPSPSNNTSTRWNAVLEEVSRKTFSNGLKSGGGCSFFKFASWTI